MGPNKKNLGSGQEYVESDKKKLKQAVNTVACANYDEDSKPDDHKAEQSHVECNPSKTSDVKSGPSISSSLNGISTLRGEIKSRLMFSVKSEFVFQRTSHSLLL